MTFEEVLVTTLQSGSTITVYPLEKPQNVTTPVAVYKRLSTVRLRLHNTKSTFNKVRMSVTVYGTSFKAVSIGVENVMSLLDENKTAFTFSYLTDKKDFKESESGLFYTYMEYVFFAHLN